MILEPKVDLELSKWTCPFCNQTRKSQTAIEKHILRHSGEKQFACDLCDFVSNRKDKLTRHSSTHNTENSQTANEKPIVNHSGEKQFPCELCDYVANRKDRLIRHSYTHSAEKPFACNFCEFATSRKDKLKNHIERLHPSLENKN